MGASRPGRERLGRAATAAGLIIVSALAALAAEKPSPSAPPAPIRYSAGREIARLVNAAITESSGLAASRIREGVFWTHNDARNKPELFAFNLKGEDLGTFAVEGATAVDWEDLASFSVGKKHFLLIADVGDNYLRRKSYKLYFVEEPALPGKPSGPARLPVAIRVDFTYEDGPHNCEAAAVDPVRKEVLLVSKTTEKICKAYVLPLPRAGRVKGAVAKAVATLEIPTTTAMDVPPDGLRAVVLTYGDAREYTRTADEDWAAAFGRAPRTLSMPARAQGESICYGADGRTLYLTSEKLPTPLLEVAPLPEESPARGP